MGGTTNYLYLQNIHKTMPAKHCIPSIMIIALWCRNAVRKQSPLPISFGVISLTSAQTCASASATTLMHMVNGDVDCYSHAYEHERILHYSGTAPIIFIYKTYTRHARTSIHPPKSRTRYGQRQLLLPKHIKTTRKILTTHWQKNYIYRRWPQVASAHHWVRIHWRKID